MSKNMSSEFEKLYENIRPSVGDAYDKYEKLDASTQARLATAYKEFDELAKNIHYKLERSAFWKRKGSIEAMRNDCNALKEAIKKFNLLYQQQFKKMHELTTLTQQLADQRASGRSEIEGESETLITAWQRSEAQRKSLSNLAPDVVQMTANLTEKQYKDAKKQMEISFTKRMENIGKEAGEEGYEPELTGVTITGSAENLTLTRVREDGETDSFTRKLEKEGHLSLKISAPPPPTNETFVLLFKMTPVNPLQITKIGNIETFVRMLQLAKYVGIDLKIAESVKKQFEEKLGQAEHKHLKEIYETTNAIPTGSFRAHIDQINKDLGEHGKVPFRFGSLPTVEATLAEKTPGEEPPTPPVKFRSRK